MPGSKALSRLTSTLSRVMPWLLCTLIAQPKSRGICTLTQLGQLSCILMWSSHVHVHVSSSVCQLRLNCHCLPLMLLLGSFCRLQLTFLNILLGLSLGSDLEADPLLCGFPFTIVRSPFCENSTPQLTCILLLVQSVPAGKAYRRRHANSYFPSGGRHGTRWELLTCDRTAMMRPPDARVHRSRPIVLTSSCMQFQRAHGHIQQLTKPGRFGLKASHDAWSLAISFCCLYVKSKAACEDCVAQ